MNKNQSTSENSTEAYKRLADLLGQHAALAARLRDLHQSANDIDNTDWMDLENEVVKMRFEIETFKQYFVARSFVNETDFDNLLEI